MWDLTTNKTALYTEDENIARLAEKEGLKEMCRYWKHRKYFAKQFVGHKEKIQKVIKQAKNKLAKPIDILETDPIEKAFEEKQESKINGLLSKANYAKKCAVPTCNNTFIPNSNSQKYCPECRAKKYKEAHNKAAREYYRRKKQNSLQSDREEEKR